MRAQVVVPMISYDIPELQVYDIFYYNVYSVRLRHNILLPILPISSGGKKTRTVCDLHNFIYIRKVLFQFYDIFLSLCQL